MFFLSTFYLLLKQPIKSFIDKKNKNYGKKSINNEIKLPAGWLDWNTLTLDQMVNHLEQEFKYSSACTAKCIHHLIEFYKQNKK